MLFKVNGLGVNRAKRTQPAQSFCGVHLGQREEFGQAILRGQQTVNAVGYRFHSSVCWFALQIWEPLLCIA